jgi:hypothetical protein
MTIYHTHESRVCRYVLRRWCWGLTLGAGCPRPASVHSLPEQLSCSQHTMLLHVADNLGHRVQVTSVAAALNPVRGSTRLSSSISSSSSSSRQHASTSSISAARALEGCASALQALESNSVQAMRITIMCLQHEVGLLMQHLQGAKLLQMLPELGAIQNQLFEGSQTLITMDFNMGTRLQQLEELLAQCVQGVQDALHAQAAFEQHAFEQRCESGLVAAPGLL